MRRWYFTSESVTEGHPDKVADRISDAVLDAVLAADPEGRVACETLVTSRLVVLAGELRTSVDVDFENAARWAIHEIGYVDDPEFSADTVEVQVVAHRQSADIAGGVDRSWEARKGSDDALDQLGAGDQGLMFGYATNETDALMPAPIHYAHAIARTLADVRKAGTLPYLRPDGKTQITVEYDGERPVRIERVLVSTQHDPSVDGADEIRDEIWKHVVEASIPAELLDGSEFIVNPSGRFVIGGPHGDTGLTGRKIIVDTYGGYARHGGGAFSGKDPTKVDRSAAYAARHAAKNVVAAGLATRCELQVSYAIGQAHPFSLYLDTFGTEQVDPQKLEHLLGEFFDFRPAAIIERLGLRAPVFTPTAAYGHFGRNETGFTWESTDQAAELAKAAEAL